MTPRAIDQEEYVNREGKSAFYAPTTSTVSKIQHSIFLHLRSPFVGAINKHIRGFLWFYLKLNFFSKRILSHQGTPHLKPAQMRNQIFQHHKTNNPKNSQLLLIFQWWLLLIGQCRRKKGQMRFLNK